jgi:hypothetical protein
MCSLALAESQKSISPVPARAPISTARSSLNAHKLGNHNTSLVITDSRQDIQTCQDSGKLILLGLGGSVGSYGFSNSSQAADFATTLWDMFGEGWGSIRPFGWVTVDGFDLGIDYLKELMSDRHRY